MKAKFLLILTLGLIYLAPVTAEAFLLVGLFDTADAVVTWSKILKSKDKVTGEVKYHTRKLGLGHKLYDWPVFPFTRNFWKLADKLELKKTFIFTFPLVVFFDQNESGFEDGDGDGGAVLTDMPVLKDHPAVLKDLAALVSKKVKDATITEDLQPIVLTEEEVAPIVNALVTVDPEERQALIEKLTGTKASDDKTAM